MNNKSKNPSSFSSMNFSRPVLKAIYGKGYKQATPIQRKCIPTIMSGRDVVAMARTGSGKSAAFLLPIIDKLKIRQLKQGIRSLIISPTRELSTQTFKFAKEFCKYTSLTVKLIVGGGAIASDFETIESSPDILIATPGRLAHVLIEMKKMLNSIEVVVFDEADRLFELGFKEMEQVNEICTRLPDSKQTLLFSATLPQQLADFAKAGLKNPAFVRLDVENTLSEELKSVHVHCSQEDKYPVLMHLLKNFVRDGQMTVVFMPTRHHIEYAKMLLDKANLDCCHVYSSMDPEARKESIKKFTSKKCHVMLVTDIAARGIDIPMLDIVINYNFPHKPKLFVHRVGRVARAGRNGFAISLVAHDETPYLHTLYIFLSKDLKLVSDVEKQKVNSISDLPDMVFGSVPQNILDCENEIIKRWLDHDDDLKSMAKVSSNAMKPYLKARPVAEAASVEQAKKLHRGVIGCHPLFGSDGEDMKRTLMLQKIKAFKPHASETQVQRNKDEPLKKRKDFTDSKFYLKYKPDNEAREKGLQIAQDTLDLHADDKLDERASKKIRTEAGTVIKASYSSGLYDKWRKGRLSAGKKDGIGKLRQKLKPTKKRWELKSDEKILKEKSKIEKREAIEKRKLQHSSNKKSFK